MISKILGQSSFWIVNKELSKKLSIYPALLLSDLIDKQEYFSARGELDDEGYFFNTSEDIEESTTMTYHLQKKCLKTLQDNGLVETKLKGLPAKVHFKVNETQILKFLNTCFRNFSNQVLENFELNNNKHNNIIYTASAGTVKDYSQEQFLLRWKAAREYYDKKPTFISKLKHHDLSIFKELVKSYDARQFDKAINGLFSQKTYPHTRVNPTHFLENFEQYLTCGETGEKLFETKPKQNNKTGML